MENIPEFLTAGDTSAFVDTDLGGFVLGSDEAAAQLLGVSRRWLLARDLLTFFPADRQQLARNLGFAIRGCGVPPIPVTLYRRDRSRAGVLIQLTASASMVTWSIASTAPSATHGQHCEDTRLREAV